MSITVHDFNWVQGENDAEYIKLLQDALERQRDLTNKAAAKLRAQEPKVMVLEEVRYANETPMWFESKGTFRGQKGFWVLSKGVSPSYVIRLIPAIGKDDTELSLAAYGKVWRCWTSRPTDEQREATPWNV